jgi:hypothetical protein
MKFCYKKLSSGVLRPIVPIGLSFRSKSIKYFAVVDSGADICLFHSEIAGILGINIEDGEEGSVGGITQGEIQQYYIHPVTLSVGGWDFPTKVGFMPTLSKLGYGLLGQRGFFDLFKSVKFEFDGSKGEIEFKK